MPTKQKVGTFIYSKYQHQCKTISQARSQEIDTPTEDVDAYVDSTPSSPNEARSSQVGTPPSTSLRRSIGEDVVFLALRSVRMTSVGRYQSRVIGRMINSNSDSTSSIHSKTWHIKNRIVDT